ncbi:BTAD domain-containing putative transcriptional regulator [Streptomyces sp. NPDC050759]|uniref:AfsR/SARP family transcriptional regulator n=1 Tax=Streptomyces sp. NPDC050759 TaxID=3365635 RepID=UPI00379CBE86
MPVEVKVLGPLFVGDGCGVEYAPTAPKSRQLLALLVLNANQVVSTAMCIDELWGSSPPASAASTVQTYILQIRRALRRMPALGGSQAESLRTRHQGYQFVVGREEMDLFRFKESLAQARIALTAENYELGASLLQEGLGTWRGPALVDVQAGPLISMHLTQLGELRFSALEQRIEAELRMGLHHELISELFRLVEEFPVHENLHAQLMVALYRAGRRAQALEVYQQLRTVLISELGIEPSSRIQHLHGAVLSNDSALEPPVARPSGLARSLDLVGSGPVGPGGLR